MLIGLCFPGQHLTILYYAVTQHINNDYTNTLDGVAVLVAEPSNATKPLRQNRLKF